LENELSEEELNKIDLVKVSRLIFENVLNIEIPKIGHKANFSEMLKFDTETSSNIVKDVQKKIFDVSDKVIIKKFGFRPVNYALRNKVLPFIKNKEDESMIIEKVTSVISWKLTDLPF